MKIGIFGGSFNPPHKVHRQIVETLKKQGYVDKIIIVPTGLHYEYKSNLVDNRHRLDMLHLLFYDLDYVSISDYEMKQVCKVVGVDHFIKSLPNSYDTIIEDNDSISSGQKQLITIARGMLNKAPFLILDKVTKQLYNKKYVQE